MRYLLLSIIIISLVGILMVPNAFAVKEITVQNAPGSSVSGCEKTDRCFIPSTAKINPGDTVVWTNPDTMYHIVASGTTADGSDGIFDSGLILAGQTFSYKFNKSGTYDYFCLSHPWMEGTVVVGGGTSSPNSPSKTSTTLTLDVDSTFKTQAGSDYAIVTFSGVLETRDHLINGATIKLVFERLTFDGKDHYEVETGAGGKFSEKLQIPVGKNWSVRAAFAGGTLESGGVLAPSKSQTEYFTVTSTSSPTFNNPTQSSGGFEYALITFILLGVGAGVAAVFINKSRKKTPKATPQRKTFGAKQPKKRRTVGSPVGASYSTDGPSTYGYFECPKCHEPSAPQGKLGQNPDGSQFCSVCGWRS